jgi:hypothetical protein
MTLTVGATADREGEGQFVLAFYAFEHILMGS